MKFLPHNRIGSRRTTAGAFTLAEMLIATTIFIMVIGAMVCLQIFALRIYTLAATKISATSGGRKVLNQMRDQIRQANQAYVGNCTIGASSFSQITNTQPAQGNALKVLSSTNPMPYVIYYLDTNTSPGTNVLMQYSLTLTYSNNIPIGTNITTAALASYITNLIVFDAEDYTNHILTNNQNNQCFKITLQFSQWEYPVAIIGGQALNAYDYYQLRTKISIRAPEID
jgi:type II secretory pathway pseudopilin PulG